MTRSMRVLMEMIKTRKSELKASDECFTVVCSTFEVYGVHKCRNKYYLKQLIEN